VSANGDRRPQRKAILARAVVVALLGTALAASCFDESLAGKRCDPLHPCEPGFTCVLDRCLASAVLEPCEDRSTCAADEACIDAYCVRPEIFDAGLPAGEGEGEGERR
jgi:hypothetical protein